MPDYVATHFLQTQHGLIEIDTDPSGKLFSHSPILLPILVFRILSVPLHDLSLGKYESLDNKEEMQQMFFVPAHWLDL
jgi:hypothetical protein